MAKSLKKNSVYVSDEELALLRKLRESAEGGTLATPATPAKPTKSAEEKLVDAFVTAIERTKPPAKITIANRKANTPWTPAPGEPFVKLKRKFFHHALPVEDKVSNEEKELLNQLKPGKFCENWVEVRLRKDDGLDIDYPVRTNVQRLKLVNKFGIRSFAELLRRIIDEKTYPAKYRKAEDKDLYDTE